MTADLYEADRFLYPPRHVLDRLVLRGWRSVHYYHDGWWIVRWYHPDTNERLGWRAQRA